MPKVILIIGRLCSGKTTYARKVAQEEHAVHLNCDELMRTLFPEPLGEDYDRYLARAFDYLFTLTRRLAESGAISGTELRGTILRDGPEKGTAGPPPLAPHRPGEAGQEFPGV